MQTGPGLSPPLQVLASARSGPFRFGGLTLADFGGADFVGGFVAGALEGAPHVPAGDGSVGAPAFAELQEFLGLWHVLFAVGDGPAFFYAEVVDRENVGTAEPEDQKHFNGPGADAAYGDEALDQLFVGEFFGLFERGDDAGDGLLREVFHGQDFCAGEPGFAKHRLAKFQHLLGRRRAAVAAQRLDAAKDGGRGFAGNGLVGDGFEERFVGRLKLVGVSLEGNGIGDEFGEFFVDGGEMLHSLLEIEGRSADGLGSVFEHG